MPADPERKRLPYCPNAVLCANCTHARVDTHTCTHHVPISAVDAGHIQGVSIHLPIGVQQGTEGSFVLMTDGITEAQRKDVTFPKTPRNQELKLDVPFSKTPNKTAFSSFIHSLT